MGSSCQLIIIQSSIEKLISMLMPMDFLRCYSKGNTKTKLTLYVFYTHQMQILPVSSREIRRGTMADSTMWTQTVFEMVTTGRFPADKDTRSELSPFLIRLNELTVQQGCLMWGIQVIAPLKLRPCVLAKLHVAHPGVVRMKSLARSYV